MSIIKYTKQLLIAALGIFIVSIGIILLFGLRPGIDFTGGALTEVSYDVRPSTEAVSASIDALSNDIALGGYSLRETVTDRGRDGYILRTRDLTETERQSIEATMLGVGEAPALDRFTSIGPVIGQELRSKAVWAIAAVVGVIILFVAFAFRSVAKPVGSWTYGGITILALAHDVLIPTALMSILGYMIGAEVDVLFVMAMLAVLGYSVNDTIVVFDRVRENLVKNRQEKKVKKDGVESIEYILNKPFREIVGVSVNETLMRSINTSLTTLVALSALYFLGGEVTQNFALVLIAGVIAGTYSSLCIANPLLVYLGERSIAKQSQK